MPSHSPLIGYCTNVHAGTSLEQTMDNLRDHSRAVREHLGDPELGIGLWLPETVIDELEQPGRSDILQSCLEELGLFVFTMNGFPQGDFHAKVVKTDVYRPDWQDPRRADYTVRLARLLEGLAPGALGELSISTLPVGWRGSVQDLEGAVGHLVATARELERLESETGRLVHVDLEPEPGCYLDTAGDVVGLFERLPDFSRRYLRVCHDICHSAVMFEPQDEVLARYRGAGIEIGKVQVSSCPEFRIEPGGGRVRDVLEAFAEPRYLHQSVVRREDGSTIFFEDLPRLLDSSVESGILRVHFHVPLFIDSLGPLDTTQSEIRDFMRACRGELPPLEVETYAWNVLPAEHAPVELAEGIAREIRWLRGLVEAEGRGSAA